MIGAFQRLLSETEQDPDFGDESVEEPKDDRECDGPLVPRDPSDVYLMKPRDRREEYESLSSDSDYGLRSVFGRRLRGACSSSTR